MISSMGLMLSLWLAKTKLMWKLAFSNVEWAKRNPPEPVPVPLQSQPSPQNEPSHRYVCTRLAECRRFVGRIKSSYADRLSSSVAANFSFSMD